MDMLRHVAKIANTDQRCVVAFMQIPGREDHALVIPIDNLPPRMEQAVMDVLNTPEGQNEETFAIALSRRLLPDTGQNILEALHKNNRLTAVPVAQVLMMPQPNRPIKLSTVLESLNRLPGQASPGTTEDYSVNKFNPHTNNQQAGNAENNRNIARNLLISAEMMESDALRKREQAYSYDPSLRPTKVPDSVGNLEAFTMMHNQDVVELVPEAKVETDTTMFDMLTKLMERVEAQDKVLNNLQQSKAQVHRVSVKPRRTNTN